MMLFTLPEIMIFKVLRSSDLMKEISTNSVSIRKLNGYGIRTEMVTEFVLISFITQEERKTLNINNLAT